MKCKLDWESINRKFCKYKRGMCNSKKNKLINWEWAMHCSINMISTSSARSSLKHSVIHSVCEIEAWHTQFREMVKTIVLRQDPTLCKKTGALCSHFTNSTQFKNLCSHLCLNAISVIKKKGISILAHAVSYRMSSVKATSSLSKKKKKKRTTSATFPTWLHEPGLLGMRLIPV